jgi:putative membrane protein
MASRVVREFTFLLAIIAIASLGLSTTAMAQSSDRTANKSSMAATSGKLVPADRQFIRKAAEGGLAEVELGKLAADKAVSPEVKQFGQRMVDDHSKANDQLKQVASEKGVTVPDKLDAKDAATKARLEKLSGKAFDHAYMRDMVIDHTKDVSDFRMESKNAKDPDVKNFASQALPTLEDHLKQAKGLAPKPAKLASQPSGTY